jgi:hypothetical protein
VPDDPAPPRYYVPKQAAAEAGISVQALYERLNGPHPPPAKRIGRKWLLPVKEFLEWLSQGRIE